MPDAFSLDYRSSLQTGNNGVVAISNSIKQRKG